MSRMATPTARRPLPGARQLRSVASTGCLVGLWALGALTGCSGAGSRGATLAGAEGEGAQIPPWSPALPPPPSLPGDRLAYRLVDHAGAAKLETTSSLSAQYQALDTPYKMLSPYSGLRGEAALRVVEVAIAEPGVENYPERKAAAESGKPPPRFDPVWNRYRGVYESKVALLAPPTSCYRFAVELPSEGRLTLHTALVPNSKAGATPAKAGAAVEFAVALDDKPLFSRKLPGPDGAPGHWLPADLPLPRGPGNHQLSLCTKVPEGAEGLGTPLWGNPELWATREGASGPNVLLVLIDTLRADAVPQMPRLEALAQGSVRFETAITAATWTRPALLSLLGGDLPTAVGQDAEEMIPSERDRQRFYALDRRLLPRLLRHSGYKVASIGNNFFLLGYPRIGLSLGFDEVADVRHPVEDSPAITRAAVQFLKEHKDRSFFLQLHYDAPHWPYTPPAEFQKHVPDTLVAKLSVGSEQVEKGTRLDPQARAYLGEAAYADAQLGLILDQLKQLGLEERTLVIVVGDHGEVFDARHNHYVLALQQPTLYHHGWSAYDEILRVPLVLSMPGRLPRGVSVKAQVRLPDVAPTVLDVLGLSNKRAELPGGTGAFGRTLLPLMLGPKPGEPTERPAFVEGQNVRALRSNGFLYLRRSDPRLQRAQGDSGSGPVTRVSEELYDLTKDPAQHNDLLLGSRELSPPLQKTLDDLRQAFAMRAPQPPDAALPVTHLALAPDSRGGHLLSGTVRSTDSTLAVRAVQSGEVTPLGPGLIRISLRSGGSLEFLVDAAAKVELQLSRDGLPMRAEQLLIGPYSLPLRSTMLASTAKAVADAGAAPSEDAGLPLVLDGPVLDRLTAQYSPVLGERGEVLLWRDQAAAGVAAAVTAARSGGSESEVSTAMRDWGYARPEAPGATGGAPSSPSATARQAAPSATP